MSGRSDEGPEPADRPEGASNIAWRGYIALPSWYDPDRYQPERPGSSRLAWLLGTGGLLLSPLSIAGAVSGWRSARRGNRAGAAATVWCIATLVTSLAFWGPLLLGGSWSPPTSVVLVAGEARTGGVPPAGLGFAASLPTGSYAELDLGIRNPARHAIASSPSSIEVHDRSGGRLAWATDDAVFLNTSELAPGITWVHIWIALPAGRIVGSVDVGDGHVEVR